MRHTPRPLFVLLLGISCVFNPVFVTALHAYQGTLLKLTGLRTEYKENPLGIDSRKPRLSWQLQASGRGTAQAAYHIRVAKAAVEKTDNARCRETGCELAFAVHRAVDEGEFGQLLTASMAPEIQTPRSLLAGFEIIGNE